MLAPGTIVGDKYRLVRVLGRGGMGVVMEARHVQLGTSFALKFVHRSIIETASVTERFLREARATAALRSEHVCRVFDVGSFEGAPYLVMELLDGTDLERVLRREKRLAPSVACGYLIQACAGVAEAHAAEIVHRDLKPGNLFLMMRAEGTPLIKVLDFGIAKAPEKAELGLTGTDAILGSPAYMSLEQLRSSRLVDVRSDIWSLGVILYELVAGRRPFNGEGVADLALRIAMEPIPKLPHGPAALDVVIGKCLERDPARRYQDIAELALALAPFADEPERRLAQSLNRAPRASYPIIEITSPADPSLPGDRSVATQATELLAPSETTLQSVGVIERPRPARKSRTRIGLAALVLTVAGGISLGIAATGGEGASSAAGTSAEPAIVATPAPPPPPAPAPAPVSVAAASASPSPGPSTARPASDQRPAETVTLRFAVEPAVAAVELDGVFVAARQIKVHKDDAPHVLRITAAGFASHEGEVRFDASQKLTIRLRRAPQTAVRPARPAKPQPSRIESHSPYE